MISRLYQEVPVGRLKNGPPACQLHLAASGLVSLGDASVRIVSEGIGESVRRLDEQVVRYADVRASHWYGPPPDDDCPCGSHRQANRCHRANDGSWLAEPPPPLLTGPRTDMRTPAATPVPATAATSN